MGMNSLCLEMFFTKTIAHFSPSILGGRKCVIVFVNAEFTPWGENMHLLP